MDDSTLVRGPVAVVVNTSRSMKRRPPDLAKIRETVAGRGQVWPTESLAALEETAQRVMTSQPEVVAIWGGDGTNTRTLSALLRSAAQRPLPKICLLPAGTVNNVARAMGTRGDAARTLGALLRGRSKLHRRTLIQVRSAEGVQAGFLFGLGLINNAMALYDQGGSTGGLKTAKVFLSALPSLIRARSDDPLFKPFAAQVRVLEGSATGVCWSREDWTNLSAATVRTLPYGLPAFHRAEERPGAFHLVGHSLRARGAMLELVSIASGRGMRNVLQEVCAQVEIEPAQPQPFNMDGESFPPQAKLLVEGGPQLQALVPRG